MVTGSRNWESTESAAPSARIIATNVRGDADSSAGAIRSRKPTHTVPSGAPDTRKKANEGWADFADDLKALADKGYPTLQEEAREQLAINAFLQQLTQPQIAFSVKQKRPKTLDDAVAATLEMESYLAGPSPVGIASTLSSAENLPVCPVSALSQVDKLTQAVEQRVERLQRDTRLRPRRAFTGECWTCRQPGHMARNCPQTRSTHQGKLATSSAMD